MNGESILDFLQQKNLSGLLDIMNRDRMYWYLNLKNKHLQPLLEDLEMPKKNYRRKYS